MAYETGIALDLDDLINVKLKTFMVNDGWKLNADSWGTHLALSKGACFVNFRSDKPTAFNDAFGVSRTDHRLRGHLASSFSGGGYTGQPDSLVSSTSDTDQTSTNDLTGPFTSYHLFSGGPGDPAYVYMAVESLPGFFTHALFGEIDDLNFGYSPRPCFITGQFYNWWPSSTNPSNDWAIRWSGSGHGAAFIDATHNFYTEGLYPAGPKMINGILQIMGTGTETVFADDKLLDVLDLGPSPVNGNTPFMPAVLAMTDQSVASTYNVAGQMANFRLCSMAGRAPKEEVTLGSDTWVLFPWRKQQDSIVIAQPASPSIDNSSYQYGYAVKKVL